MQCIDFANRLNLIPLPNVIQAIIQTYLSNDLIPLRVVEVGKKRVSMVHDDDIYYSLYPIIYKNDHFIATAFHVSNTLRYLEDDWVVLNDEIYNTLTHESIPLSKHRNIICTYNGIAYFYKDNAVHEAWIENGMCQSRPIPQTVNVRHVHVVGTEVNFLHVNGSCQVKNRMFQNCNYAYEWQSVFYLINHQYIRTDQNDTVFAFEPKFYICHLFAFEETLVIQNFADTYFFSLATHKLIHIDYRLQCNDRLYRVENGLLSIYH